jgi:uncharacterized membrane protein YtjA (UPF0391 family)
LFPIHFVPPSLPALPVRELHWGVLFEPCIIIKPHGGVCVYTPNGAGDVLERLYFPNAYRYPVNTLPAILYSTSSSRELKQFPNHGGSRTSVRPPIAQFERSQEDKMLRWALGFFVIALVAALLGFTGIAVASAGIAKIIFFIFLILFVVSFLGHFFRRV